MKKWSHTTKKFRRNSSKDEKVNIVLENSYEILNRNEKICDMMEKIKLGKILFDSYPSIKIF